MHVDAHTIAEELRKLGDMERRVVDHFIRRRPIVKDPNVAFDDGLTLGQRVADRVATFGGSWTFIFLFFALMGVWMFINTDSRQPFDVYPFILLNLILSCLAALQAPVIMMSQNRQAAKDRIEAQNDYEVNLKAEMEIVALHLKLDELREGQWSKLLELQERQLAMLERLNVGGQPNVS